MQEKTVELLLWHSGAQGKGSPALLGPFCVELECSHWLLWFPHIVQSQKKVYRTRFLMTYFIPPVNFCITVKWNKCYFLIQEQSLYCRKDSVFSCGQKQQGLSGCFLEGYNWTVGVQPLDFNLNNVVIIISLISCALGAHCCFRINEGTTFQWRDLSQQATFLEDKAWNWFSSNPSWLYTKIHEEYVFQPLVMKDNERFKENFPFTLT